MAGTQGNRAALVSSVADKALATFVIIQSMLRRSGKLREYQHNSALSERLPDYEVQMGFGLHVGWAIQGAIGSEYKVDASYLSPNINLASRLEVCPGSRARDCNSSNSCECGRSLMRAWAWKTHAHAANCY